MMRADAGCTGVISGRTWKGRRRALLDRRGAVMMPRLPASVGQANAYAFFSQAARIHVPLSRFHGIEGSCTRYPLVRSRTGTWTGVSSM